MPHGFRFPLILDQRLPLCEQVRSSGFASASSRFGPYCDNIMGMNWKLRDGRVVRIGERVVKSTTGYDLLRFLLNSDGRFGEPLDFVLRLRPDCGTSGVFTLSGTHNAVSRAVAALLATCWIHWFDAVDVLFDGDAESCRLRIALNCPAEEWSVYETYLSSFAVTHDLALKSDSSTPLAPDGCPDFVLKTTTDQAVAIAREISNGSSIKCLTLCYNGVVHGYLKQADAHSQLPPQISAIKQRYQQQLHEVGGEFHSRHLADETPTGTEAEWLNRLRFCELASAAAER